MRLFLRGRPPDQEIGRAKALSYELEQALELGHIGLVREKGCRANAPGPKLANKGLCVVTAAV